MKERVGLLRLGHIYNHPVIVEARARTKTTSLEENDMTATGRPSYATTCSPFSGARR
jgi:hypothetical protein